MLDDQRPDLASLSRRKATTRAPRTVASPAIRPGDLPRLTRLAAPLPPNPRIDFLSIFSETYRLSRGLDGGIRGCPGLSPFLAHDDGIEGRAVTKSDMAEHLFNELGLNRREAKDLIDSAFEEIRMALERGEEVKLSGFGVFDLGRQEETSGAQPEDR